MTAKEILIIEDEKAITDLLAYALQREGYTIRTAATGKAGLESCI